jgi:hypothetical protein
MEIIYDLRGQMELLFQEMSELRKTLKNCTDMQIQIQLQQSQNQEVHKGMWSYLLNYNVYFLKKCLTIMLIMMYLTYTCEIDFDCSHMYLSTCIWNMIAVKGKKCSNKKSKKGNCCICNENKVNSVLYRY